MNWQMSLILMFLLFAALGAAACIHDACDRRKHRAMLRKLNSPFFRNVTDAYYRVGNISGVGR